MRTADPAKVRRIIDAAIQLFAERPFHEVRMEDIAARAQVAKGTLYLHYKDKEDLFLGIMNDGLQSLVERIEESLSAEMPPEEKLLVMNRESFRYFERNHFFLDVIQRVEFFRFGARSACFEETRARMQGILLRIFREFPSRAAIFRPGARAGGRGALGHDEGDPAQPAAPVARRPPRAGDAPVPARHRSRRQVEGRAGRARQSRRIRSRPGQGARRACR